MQPINYMLDVQSPIQTALAGYMQGKQFRAQEQGMEMQRQQFNMQKQQFEAAQAQIAQQQARAQEVQGMMAQFAEQVAMGDVTAQDVIQMQIAVPEMAESIENAWSTLSEQQTQGKIQEYSKLAVALRRNPDLALQMIDDRILAAENAGDMEQLNQMKAIRAQAEMNPEAVMSAILMELSTVMDPEQFDRFMSIAMPPQTELRETVLGDETVLYDPTSRDAQSTIQVLGAAPVTSPLVEVDFSDKADQTFAVEMAKLDAGDIAAISTQGQTARRNAQTLNELQTALSSSPSGAEAALVSALGNVGIKTASTEDVEWANSLISKLIPGQRAPGSGPMSDKDIDLFRASLPRLINTPGGNAKILSTMIAMNNYMIREGELADAVKSGAITREQYREQIRALGNPLAEFSSGGTTGSAPAAQAPTPRGLPVINSQAAYDSLPSGAKYTTPGGGTRTKP